MKVDCVTEAMEEQFNAGKNEGKLEGKLEGIEKGIEKGMEKGKIEIIKDLFNDGELTTENTISRLLSLKCEFKTISEITGLTEKEIKDIANTK
ncbi:hypothetical protein [Methanobrevibacter sp.]|uniref:hypothetical protein n=1 Tax=Methanobrevibacter sp. TaxID=66852 RepID=UPI0038901914